MFTSAGFNLNLLECKFWGCCSDEEKLSVLISTYWNVNQGCGPQRCRPQLVLISTYWNVNLLDDYSQRLSQESFNLNLLECKSNFRRFATAA